MPESENTSENYDRNTEDVNIEDLVNADYLNQLETNTIQQMRENVIDTLLVSITLGIYILYWVTNGGFEILGSILITLCIVFGLYIYFVTRL